MKINIEYLKKVMDKKKVDVSGLAHLVGKKENWIYSVLAGKAGNSFRSVELFANKLGVDPLKLVAK